jgi:hypothetical protein
VGFGEAAGFGEGRGRGEFGGEPGFAAGFDADAVEGAGDCFVRAAGKEAAGAVELVGQLIEEELIGAPRGFGHGGIVAIRGFLDLTNKSATETMLPMATGGVAEFFRKCFPADEFPATCSVSQAWSVGQEDLADILRAVEAAGQLVTLKERIRREHPTDRPHVQQHDDRLWDALFEAAALAWTAEWSGREPMFWDKPGQPDIRVSDFAWIEAKVVHRSEDENEFLRDAIERTDGLVLRGPSELAHPHPTLLKKLDHGWTDALRKFERLEPDQAQRIVWMAVQGLDFPTSPHPAGMGTD